MSPMLRNRITALAVGIALSMVTTVPAQAAAFIVHLKNDTTFETLHQPKAASWDESTILVITEAGNWIGLPKTDIDHISSVIEARGIGRVIDSRTIALGNLPNDAPTDDELAKERAARDPLERFLERLEGVGQAPAQPDYTQQQFVNPDQTTGIPLNYLGNFP